MKHGLILAFALFTSSSHATTILGPWVPKFKGVDFSVSTNIPTDALLPHRQVVYALRVDLTDPDIRFLTTPPISNSVASVREVGGLTVSDFLVTHHLQAALNANFFDARNYYLAPGTPMDVYGLAISEGIVVSEQENASYPCVLEFDDAKRPTFIPSNWPATDVSGVHTAIAGDLALVVGGKNVVSRVNKRDVAPRTLYGLSEDRRYLFMIAIDGRQSGYSDGADDDESARWLLLLGAYDGVNVDGGGSTTLVMEDSLGAPLRLNQSSAVADSGRERTVGSHFGLYARPLLGFINDVSVTPDDTTATVTWTTTEPASARVEYGTTTDLGATTLGASELTMQHTVGLSGLSPGTRYYYRVGSGTSTQDYVSPLQQFTTDLHVTTTSLLAVTNTWKYSTDDPGQSRWMDPDFDDAAWSGPVPGGFWVDVRTDEPNPLLGALGTEMPVSAAESGYPFVTYYLRTHFQVTHVAAGATLAFTVRVDDGAVFYLNGAEIYRLRVPVGADAQTVADGYPCDGDAVCAETFTLPVASLVKGFVGNNVLAAEVHNYNRRSPDITFGTALDLVEPTVSETRLTFQFLSGAVTLAWEGSGFVLQSAGSLAGPWTDVVGVTSSPYRVVPESGSQFYRLRR